MKKQVKNKLIHRHQPCLSCDSSDAMSIYDDHSSYCFSCNKYFSSEDTIFSLTNDEKYVKLKYTLGNTKGNKPIINNPNNKPIGNTLGRSAVGKFKEVISYDGLNKDTIKFFGVYHCVDGDKPTHIAYPYANGGIKYRNTDKKEFFSEGPMSTAGLFGKDKFPAGSAKALTITEGEKDALSVFQMMGKYPCVSVRSASCAEADCAQDQEYINSFDKIYLCFDSDEAGREAAAKVARMFDVDKVYHVKMDKHKDANEYLKNGDEKAFKSTWWASKRIVPKGVVVGYDAVADVLSKIEGETIGTYPFPTLEHMTCGIRGGEFILFTAQEGIGKTEVFRAIEHHLLTTTAYNVGVVHIEEGEKRSIQGLIGYHMGKPIHLPDSSVSLEEQIKAYKDMVPDENKLMTYSHYGTDDPDAIIETIRYLATVGECKFIFLDHISMLVSGLENDNERGLLDRLSTKLSRLAHDVGTTIFVISHVNDEGQTRGSRYIGKLANLHIHMDRNKEAATVTERNKTSLMVRKNRFAGRTGPAGYLSFDPATFNIKELTLEQLQTEADLDTLPSF